MKSVRNLRFPKDFQMVKPRETAFFCFWSSKVPHIKSSHRNLSSSSFARETELDPKRTLPLEPGLQATLRGPQQKQGAIQGPRSVAAIRWNEISITSKVPQIL